ncbi:hypothetical protein DASB73_007040 [Starmerella bacillaris]|uniref:Uncharacterized protein n=1 Tax=Starmerella bacillaris TaxID=1247836 RepID=A0AAV5REW5_STABA|nr:hypothetical protein DASB73_007040 [Starmerella bacillaris]
MSTGETLNTIMDPTVEPTDLYYNSHDYFKQEQISDDLEFRSEFMTQPGSEDVKSEDYSDSYSRVDRQEPYYSIDSQRDNYSSTDVNEAASRPEASDSNVIRPKFQINLDMVRRTMTGINNILGVKLGGTEVGPSALMENPADDPTRDTRESSSSSKNEMSHYRIISDACGFIVANVGKSVLEAAEESIRENSPDDVNAFRPKPPVRKRRGGILGFKELATRAGLSPWHFHRVFRYITGVTPKTYGEALWEYLMIEAGFDLENEELVLMQYMNKDDGETKPSPDSIPSSSSSISSPRSPQSSKTSNDSPIDGSDSHSERLAKSPITASMTSPVMNPANSNSAIPLQPLSGSVPAGRVRKTGSLSRGAGSRSRTRHNRTSSLSTFTIEGNNENSNTSRGRSFSTHTSSRRARVFSNHEEDSTRRQILMSLGPRIQAADLFENAIGTDSFPEFNGIPIPQQQQYNYVEPPDMTGLSLQQQLKGANMAEPPFHNSMMGMLESASVPDYGYLKSYDYYNNNINANNAAMNNNNQSSQPLDDSNAGESALNGNLTRTNSTGAISNPIIPSYANYKGHHKSHSLADGVQSQDQLQNSIDTGIRQQLQRQSQAPGSSRVPNQNQNQSQAPRMMQRMNLQQSQQQGQQQSQPVQSQNQIPNLHRQQHNTHPAQFQQSQHQHLPSMNQASATNVPLPKIPNVSDVANDFGVDFRSSQMNEFSSSNTQSDDFYPSRYPKEKSDHEQVIKNLKQDDQLYRTDSNNIIHENLQLELLNDSFTEELSLNVLDDLPTSFYVNSDDKAVCEAQDETIELLDIDQPLMAWQENSTDGLNYPF